MTAPGSLNYPALLLLGMLRVQSQHGYQINEFIERNLSRVMSMKKATAYAALDRLARQGAVTVRTEQEGNRPPRKVYSITAEGERLFFDLLRTSLAAPDRLMLDSSLGLMFIDDLPREEVMDLLRQRLGSLERETGPSNAVSQHDHGMGVNLAIDYRTVMLRAEQAWVSDLLTQLQTERI